ncbi:hypothetical protein B5S28_g744 [[Candida] boidinii]|nr:hypothetical protein B5S28_g744 [[Candida] boidinii]OWB77693.1 hypothetical protein B5S32_g1867 [[Candida] boidinii]
MLIVGLTGGIACGKSTVSKRLEEHHKLPIVDADKIAREIVQPGKPSYNKIVTYFGQKIPNLVNDDNTLNRQALGGYVFANKDELRVLNSFTHPEVRKQMRLMNRNPELSEEECRNRIASQMGNSEKIKKSDIVVDNGSSLEELYSKIDGVVTRITPWTIVSMIEILFPPIGLISALFCYLKNRMKHNK